MGVLVEIDDRDGRGRERRARGCGKESASGKGHFD
jgi:hypothetical protein